jgi:hypothetical protein
VVTTVAAWVVAFLVVTALLTVFGDELGSLPLALRALVISGVLVALMVNLVMPASSVAIAGWVAARRRRAGRRLADDPVRSRRAVPEHPEVETLPEWPARTIAVFSTVDSGPYAIPVSARLRAGERRILFSLRRSGGSLARLRTRARIALTILTEATSRGRVRNRPTVGRRG